MIKKSGLGKGLGALIPNNNESLKNESLNNQISKISINLIRPNQNQPRKNFDEEAIQELSQSIKEHGIIQPLIVKKKDNIYTIVAGERRWRAAKLANIKELPVIIMDINPKTLLEISLIENIQREDLNCIEEALAYKKLIEDFNLTQDKLSQRIGKSRVSITNSIRLLKLDSRVRSYLIDGVISEGHGRVLLSVEDKDLQCKLAQNIIDNKLSVRQTEKLIKSFQSMEIKTSKKLNIMNPYYNDIKVKLENMFNTKVKLQHNKNKGKIEIEYYSEDDLQRILDILNL